MRRGNMTRKRRTISYQEEPDQPDLEDLLVKLRSCRNSPYWNRSLSDIGGMILSNAAEEELAKYSGREHPHPTGERDSNNDSS